MQKMKYVLTNSVDVYIFGTAFLSTKSNVSFFEH